MTGADSTETKMTSVSSKPRSWATYLVVAVLAIVAVSLVGRLSYGRGYQDAYASEHSHYLFAKTRGDAFARRIALQKKCVVSGVDRIPHVTDSGFAALGQVMSAVGLMLFTTTTCNRQADFGAVTSDEYNAIIGRR